jgi:hypothetical protein
MPTQIHIHEKTTRTASPWHLVGIKPLKEFRIKMGITLDECSGYERRRYLYETEMKYKWFQTQYWRSNGTNSTNVDAR